MKKAEVSRGSRGLPPESRSSARGLKDPDHAVEVPSETEIDQGSRLPGLINDLVLPQHSQQYPGVYAVTHFPLQELPADVLEMVSM